MDDLQAFQNWSEFIEEISEVGKQSSWGKNSSFLDIKQRALDSIRSFKYFDFGRIYDYGFNEEEILAIISNFEALEDLTIISGLSTNISKAIFNQLGQMQSLKNLTVQNHLLNFNLHHTNQLEVFKLYGIIIDASTSTRISDCLKSHSTLKEFVLSYSVDTVDIEGARKVFQALESQTQLQTLVIQINNLSIDCSFSLSKTIDNNRQLHSLTIFGDNSNHFECLLKSLTSHLYIEILSLILDQVTASFLLFINQLVQQNLSIRHLNIVAGNMSDRKKLSSIFESLGSTQTIMNVELQSLDDEEEEQFQNAIQEIEFDNPFVSINASNGSSSSRMFNELGKDLVKLRNLILFLNHLPFDIILYILLFDVKSHKVSNIYLGQVILNRKSIGNIVTFSKNEFSFSELTRCCYRWLKHFEYHFYKDREYLYL